MSDSLGSQLRFLVLISLLMLWGIFVAIPAPAACYNTPRAAVDALEANSSVSSTSEKSGYRVTKIQSDRVLGQRWAMIASCGHPEWSAFALPANEVSSLKESPKGAERLSSDSAKTASAIHAGDVVQLWKQETLSRIEVAGVSEESGAVGEIIRVRLLRSAANDQSIPEQFSGVVRGPSNVEIQP
jgi:hypothetical protein